MVKFDTGKAAAGLAREGGFTRGQADAITHVSVRATANLVTKADLDKQTADLRTEIRDAINVQTWRYVTYTGVLLAAMVAIMLAVLRLFVVPPA